MERERRRGDGWRERERTVWMPVKCKGVQFGQVSNQLHAHSLTSSRKNNYDFATHAADAAQWDVGASIAEGGALAASGKDAGRGKYAAAAEDRRTLETAHQTAAGDAEGACRR